MHIAAPFSSDIELRRSDSSGSQSSRFAEASNPTDDLQEVFSNVLRQVGRPGFAASEANPTTSSNESDVATAWASWFDSVGVARYRFDYGDGNPSVRQGKTAEDLKNDFGRIMIQAYQQGGYASPLSYLQGLSQDDLRAIQQVQHLADPIDLARLSDESALNLLIPPDAQVDADEDGLTAVGAAYTIRFPDSNTPRQVRDAWEHATGGLSETDRMMRVLEMKMPLLTANLKTDAEGNYLRTIDPGDPEWTNPMAADVYSYRESAQNWIAYLDRFRYQMPVEQYQRGIEFWSSFRDHLL